LKNELKEKDLGFGGTGTTGKRESEAISGSRLASVLVEKWQVIPKALTRIFLFTASCPSLS
jgi:hypothetical protein